MTNNFVKFQQDKYGNGKTNGRPKRKSAILQAERRTKDIVRSKMILNGKKQLFLSAINQFS